MKEALATLAPDPDITANYHGGNPFSAEANRRAASNKHNDRGNIMRLLIAASPDGLTCDELEQRLGLSHQTASARVTELRKERLVLVAGMRKTRTGSYAGVNRVATLAAQQRAEVCE